MRVSRLFGFLFPCSRGMLGTREQAFLRREFIDVRIALYTGPGALDFLVVEQRLECRVEYRSFPFDFFADRLLSL